MMYSSPYFHAPFFSPIYRRYPPKRLFPQAETVFSSLQKGNTSTSKNISCFQKTNTTNHYSLGKDKIIEGATICNTLEKEIEQKENRSCDSKPIFEIFGIKLYFDDLLILGLLFFLYSEGVQDQELFLALILLLFS